MADTKIDWATKVWNPTTGCSMGCPWCYAARMAGRRMPMGGFAGARKFTDVQCHEERLEIPLHWRKPQRVFVNSMGDLFDPAVPFEFVSRVVDVMRDAERHTFIVLTKQPARALEFATWYHRMWRSDFSDEKSPTLKRAFGQNVILGVSVTNQADWDARVPLLCQTPAAKRLVCIEPMLGPVDMSPWFHRGLEGNDTVSWVIVGGQTGPGAQPMHPDWVRSIRDQCQAAGVPLWFKSWGEWIPSGQFQPKHKHDNPFDEQRFSLKHCKHTPDCVGACACRSANRIHTNGGWDYFRVGKSRSGATLDGREWKHATFRVKEHGEPDSIWCRGIVFEMEALR